MFLISNLTINSRTRQVVKAHFDLCSLIKQTVMSMPASVKGYYVENIAQVALNLSNDSKTLPLAEINDLFNILMGCFQIAPLNPETAE